MRLWSSLTGVFVVFVIAELTGNINSTQRGMLLIVMAILYVGIAICEAIRNK